MIVDSHQHFWKLGQFEYPWMSPSLGVLCRDYLPSDLVPELARAGVTWTILVQASPSVAETDFMLDLAARHAFIAGVVGWLDLEHPDWPAVLRRFRKHPKFVGVRPAVEFIPDDRWLVRPPVIKSLRALAAEGVPLDLIVWPRHLPVVLEMTDLVPGLRCVIDHLAKPDVRSREFEPWATQLQRVAQHPSAFCKLSGLLTQADHGAWTFADVRPYLDHAVACFGPRRLMFGSDWPVCLLAADYAATLAVVRRACAPTDHAAVLGENAVRFYGLRPTGETSHALPEA